MYTEAQCHDMRENYQLVLGREEEDVLRREIWAVTLGAWIFMLMMYPLFQVATPYIFTTSAFDSSGAYGIAVTCGYIFFVAGFTVFKHILSLVLWCCAPAQSGSKNRCSIRPRALLRRLCHDIWYTLLSFLIISGAVGMCRVIQRSFDPRIAFD